MWFLRQNWLAPLLVNAVSFFSSWDTPSGPSLLFCPSLFGPMAQTASFPAWCSTIQKKKDQRLARHLTTHTTYFTAHTPIQQLIKVRQVHWGKQRILCAPPHFKNQSVWCGSKPPLRMLPCWRQTKPDRKPQDLESLRHAGKPHFPTGSSSICRAHIWLILNDASTFLDLCISWLIDYSIFPKGRNNGQNAGNDIKVVINRKYALSGLEPDPLNQFSLTLMFILRE